MCGRPRRVPSPRGRTDARAAEAGWRRSFPVSTCTGSSEAPLRGGPEPVRSAGGRGLGHVQSLHVWTPLVVRRQCGSYAPFDGPDPGGRRAPGAVGAGTTAGPAIGSLRAGERDTGRAMSLQTMEIVRRGLDLLLASYEDGIPRDGLLELCAPDIR